MKFPSASPITTRDSTSHPSQFQEVMLEIKLLTIAQGLHKIRVITENATVTKIAVQITGHLL